MYIRRVAHCEFIQPVRHVYSLEKANTPSSLYGSTVSIQLLFSQYKIQLAEFLWGKLDFFFGGVGGIPPPAPVDRTLHSVVKDWVQ